MADVNQLVVKLVLDGINESDGTSDPFHTGQVYSLISLAELFIESDDDDDDNDNDEQV